MPRLCQASSQREAAVIRGVDVLVDVELDQLLVQCSQDHLNHRKVNTTSKKHRTKLHGLQDMQPAKTIACGLTALVHLQLWYEGGEDAHTP